MQRAGGLLLGSHFCLAHRPARLKLAHGWFRPGPGGASEVVQSSDPPNDAARFAPLRWVLCIAVFLVVDIFICPVMFDPEPDVAGKVVLGMFIAQAGLYASWVVLAPRPLRVRIAAASLLGLVWLVRTGWDWSSGPQDWFRCARKLCKLLRFYPSPKKQIEENNSAVIVR